MSTRPKGMRRSKSQVARDRRRIGDLYLQGWLQCDIAEEVGVSQPTVSNDLKYLHKEWLASGTIDVGEAKSQELARLDMLEVEYWKGFIRSCEDEVVTTTRDYFYKGEPQTDVTVRRKPQAGDTKFLDGAKDCLKQRCKILGVEAPVEHEVGPRLGTVLAALPDTLKSGVMDVLSGKVEEKK